jgi:signal transduction histidine kinase
MATASRTGRQALAEMRKLLGVLRDGPTEGQLAPQPGIAQIDTLVEQVRSAGIPVDYSCQGDLGALPPGLQLTTYRIVQEALTNTLKHAGPVTRSHVSIAEAGERLAIEVRDDGAVSAAAPNDGGGLRGMRERAAVYDGTVDAGPLPDGGWRVATQLAVGAAA